MRLAVIGAAIVATMWVGGEAKAKEIASKAIYNPETKSYFQLFERHRPTSSYTWRKAVNAAAQKTHNGVRGRLAVVKSRVTHDFVARNFKPKYDTWIGLRYWCKFRKLQWVTGEVHSRKTFAIWNRPWYRKREFRCATGSIKYMAVYYTKIDQGFRWRAAGDAKGYRSYLVEYVTGKP